MISSPRVVSTTPVRFPYWIAHGMGRRSAISRSNRRNVMAIRKNFMENGRRADPIGSNPHSYGLALSEYRFSCGSQKATEIRIMERLMLIIMVISKFIILFRGLF